MSNYSILQQNTLAGLSETAQCLYLKLLGVFQGHTKDGERKALFAASRYDDRFGDVIDYIMRNCPNKPDDKTRQSLSAFFAERWRNNFMPKATGAA